MKFDQESLMVETRTGVLSPLETDFIRQHSDWILKQFKRQAGSWHDLRIFQQHIARETLIFGERVQVEFAYAPNYSYHYKDNRLLIRGPHCTEERKKHLIGVVLRKIAAVYLAKTMNRWKEITGLKVNTLRVKNHRSKWGSCSSLGNINLNWYLVMVPKNLADYIVIHELMHLKEMNHSPAFWKRVEQYYPDYRRARKELGERQWVIGVYA